MNYEEYRYRRKGAGDKRFFLVKHWRYDGFKVRELRKGNSSEEPIDEFHYWVRGVDPTSTLPNGESVKWEDQTGEKPISHHRALPDNKQEMIRANDLLDKRQQALSKIPDDTSASVRVRSDIRFLKGVVAEFRLWFIDSGFELPDDVTSDDSEPIGFYYARQLYDYLNLSSTPLEEVDYRNLKEVYEAVKTDRPVPFSITYGALNKALKNVELYPSDPGSSHTNYEKLMGLLERIRDYVEEEK